MAYNISGMQDNANGINKKNAIENMKLICSLFELSLVRTFFWDFKKPLLLQFIHKKIEFSGFHLQMFENIAFKIPQFFFKYYNHNGFVKIGKIIVQQKFEWKNFAKFYSKTENLTIQIGKL